MLRWIGALLGLGCLIYVGVRSCWRTRPGSRKPYPPSRSATGWSRIPPGRRSTGHLSALPTTWVTCDRPRARRIDRSCPRQRSAVRTRDRGPHAKGHAFRTAADHRVADDDSTIQVQCVGRDGGVARLVTGHDVPVHG